MRITLSYKMSIAFLLMAILVFITGLTGYYFVRQTGQEGLQASRYLNPLTHAALEVQLHAADAHLLMEEIMAGDDAENFDDVLLQIDEALWFANVIANGGDRDGIHYRASDSEKVQQLIRSVIVDLEEFKQASVSRHSLLAASQGAGSDADEAFDQIYEGLIEMAADFSNGDFSLAEQQRLLGDYRYNLANGHLLVAEILGGDMGEDFNQALTNFRQAQSIAKRFNSSGAKASKDIDRLLTLAESRYSATMDYMATLRNADVTFDAAYDYFIGESDEVIHEVQRDIERSLTLLEDHAQTSTSILLALVSVSLLGAVAMGWFSYLQIVRPIQQLTDSMRQVASGDRDLRNRLVVDRHDEIGQISAAFNDFVASLDSLYGNALKVLKRGALEVRSVDKTAAETHAGISDVQSRTDQLAAAINQMASTVQQISQNTDEARQRANEADAAASQGESEVRQVVSKIEQMSSSVGSSAQTINHLADSSSQIGELLSVISSISDQTNLLALNAAIEAARAGDAGRGFAVVADEVRSLAKNTETSAQQIQAMIETLQAGIRKAVATMEEMSSLSGDAVAQAKAAGDALHNIQSIVTEMSDRNTRVAESSQEQASVAEHINSNISAVYTIADDVLTLAQNNATHARLAHEAIDEVDKKMSQFKVSDSGIE